MSKVNAAPPDISVIVVFHSRLEYLPLAIDSVLRQTLPSDRFEIILVGPERPPFWKDRESAPATRFVKCGEMGLGTKVAEGFRASRADLVTFLEDDDLYAPERLAYLREAFRSDPALNYLQNGFRVIDANGRPRPAKDLHVRMMRTWLDRGAVRIPGPPSDRNLGAIRTLPSGFNTSSIAVRRALLADHLDVLGQVDMLVDVTLLYLAFLRHGYLCFDPSPLTTLRKHAGSDSNPQIGDAAEFLSRMREYLVRSQQGRTYLVRFVAAGGTLPVKRAVEGQQAVQTVILHLRAPDTSRRLRAKAILGALEKWPTFEVRRYWTALPFGLMCFLAPRSGSRAYVWFRRIREGYG